MRKSKTHFEQVPVKVVKEIAEKNSVEEEIAMEKTIMRTPTKKREPYFVGARLRYSAGSER